MLREIGAFFLQLFYLIVDKIYTEYTFIQAFSVNFVKRKRSHVYAC
jgi:hypothetical protein